MRNQTLFFPEAGRCEIEQTELDEQLKPNEVLIKTTCSLISTGTELSLFTRTHRGIDVPENKWAKYPFRCGYIATGVVIAGTALKPGTRVHHPGYHATYAKVPADAVVPIPDELSDEQAVFYGILAISIVSIRLAPAVAGQQVVTIGLGLVGNLCAQLYRETGAGVSAGADLSEARLARARACGIKPLFNTAEKPLAEWVKTLGPQGAEIIVEAVGSSGAISAALAAAPLRGRVVLLGSPRTKMEFDPYYDIHRKGTVLIGAHGMHAQNTSAADAILLMNWLREGRITVSPLITQRLPMEQAGQAYVGLRDKPDEYMGVILTY